MKTCTARLEREEDGRWTIELEEEPRVHTWGKTVDQALTRMREAAALWFNTDEGHIDLVVRPVLPKTTGRTVQAARAAETEHVTPTAWPSHGAKPAEASPRSSWTMSPS